MDLSDPNLLFCLQTSELNNTWRAYRLLQLHAMNWLHTTHIRAESKSKTSIYCLPTLSNSQILAKNISHFIYKLITSREHNLSFEILLEIPDLPVNLILSLLLLDFCSKTTILRLPGAAEKSGIQPNSLHYSSHTHSHLPFTVYSSNLYRSTDLSLQKKKLYFTRLRQQKRPY